MNGKRKRRRERNTVKEIGGREVEKWRKILEENEGGGGKGKRKRRRRKRKNSVISVLELLIVYLLYV